MTLEADEIQRFISENLLSGRAIAQDEDLLLSGLMDSMAVVALVQHLETATGKAIPPEDVLLENFKTVDAITAYLGLT